MNPVELHLGDLHLSIAPSFWLSLLGILAVLAVLGVILDLGFSALCRAVGWVFFRGISWGRIHVGQHSKERAALKRVDASRFFYMENGITYVYEEWSALTGLLLLVVGLVGGGAVIR